MSSKKYGAWQDHAMGVAEKTSVEQQAFSMYGGIHSRVAASQP